MRRPQFRLIAPDNLTAPRGHWAHRPLQRLGEFLTDAGLTVDDLFDDPDTTFATLSARHGWKPTTVALYRKAARQAGVPTSPHHHEPERVAVPTGLLLDTRLDASPALLRTGVWLALAHHHPAPASWWATATTADADRLATTDHAVTQLQRWRQLTDSLGLQTRWALPTLQPGPHGSEPGQPCAERTLRAWFRRRSQAASLLAPPSLRDAVEQLTYDRYRLWRLAEGETSARGAVRQARTPARPSTP